MVQRVKSLTKLLIGTDSSAVQEGITMGQIHDEAMRFREGERKMNQIVEIWVNGSRVTIEIDPSMSTPDHVSDIRSAVIVCLDKLMEAGGQG